MYYMAYSHAGSLGFPITSGEKLCEIVQRLIKTFNTNVIHYSLTWHTLLFTT